jgi:hypothetical protein
MCARFTVLSDTPSAAAIAGCVIPFSRNSTIWMRWRCAGGIFHRSAVSSLRTSALLHFTICFPRIRWRSESQCGEDENGQPKRCRRAPSKTRFKPFWRWYNLANMLARTGMRHKVVVISACYSGIFIPRLANPDILVITAADADHPSFGCQDKAKWTYFGDAFFNVALRPSFLRARLSRSENCASASSHRIP